MKIQRVEELVFGAEDVAAGTKYFDDWGLETIARSDKGGDFTMPSGQVIKVRSAADGALPMTNEGGSTLREAIWGVDTQATLDEIAAELSRDRNVRRDADGTLHTVDPHGFAIGFRVADEKPVPAPVPKNRLNRPFDGGERVKPSRIGHLVYWVTRGKEAEGQKFYVDRLGFRVSDRSADFGDFLRAAGSLDHHNLGMFSFRDKAGYGHIAFEVPTFDEVMLGGQYMKRQGWKPANKPGRHIVGSNTYWNFTSPCGGNTEYFSDMDMMDDEWKPRVWEKFPGAHVWSAE
jgi:catechol 2,3-dioxygenase-like lactoylglutathione lyase family enzyme